MPSSPAVIPIRIGSEDDLYCRFDPSRELLSDEVRTYLSSRAPGLRPGTQLRIEVHSPVPLDETRTQ